MSSVRTSRIGLPVSSAKYAISMAVNALMATPGCSRRNAESIDSIKSVYGS